MACSFEAPGEGGAEVPPDVSQPIPLPEADEEMKGVRPLHSTDGFCRQTICESFRTLM